jgi:hypothetical protein
MAEMLIGGGKANLGHSTGSECEVYDCSNFSPFVLNFATGQSICRPGPEIFNTVVENYVENWVSIEVSLSTRATSTSCT